MEVREPYRKHFESNKYLPPTTPPHYIIFIKENLSNRLGIESYDTDLIIELDYNFHNLKMSFNNELLSIKEYLRKSSNFLLLGLLTSYKI